jgi:hypothetical protein
MPGNKLAAFPNEIHKMIYGHLSYVEALFISITCRHLFILAQPHLYQLAVEFMYNEQSAGDRLVCVGDYTDNIPTTLLPRGATRTRNHERVNCTPGDLDPEGSVTIKEATETSLEIIEFPLYAYVTAHFTSSGPSRHNRGYDEFSENLQRIYDWELHLISQKKRAKRTNDFDPKVESDSDSDAFSFRINPAPPVMREAERWRPSNLFEQMQDQYLYLPDSRCVLRNLTTQEYVISNHHGFTQVLYAQICYSNDPSISMQEMDFEGEELHQGPWAGHRFEITTLDDIEEDRKAGKEWKDVTFRIREKLKIIYDAELGEGEYSVEQPEDSEPGVMLLEDYLFG